MTSSRIVEQDSDYSPPTEAAINVVALVGGTSSVQQDTGILGTPTAPAQFVTIGCDVVFFLTFSTNGSATSAGTVTDPVIASVSGASRTMGPYQPGVISLRADARRRSFEVISASAGTFRWYLSSSGGVI